MLSTNSLRSPEVQQAIRFVVIGVANSAFGFSIFYLAFNFGTEIARNNYWASVLISYSVGVPFSYITNSLFVFQAKSGKFLPFVAIHTGNLFANLILLSVLVEVFDADPIFSQGLVLFVLALLTYLGHSRVSFR